MNSVGDVLLIIVGVLAAFVVLDAALRTFVVPRGSVVLAQRDRVPRVRAACSRCSRSPGAATKRATASWRCTGRSRCSRCRPCSC